jgi:hypothetical protein
LSVVRGGVIGPLVIGDPQMNADDADVAEITADFADCADMNLLSA